LHNPSPFNSNSSSGRNATSCNETTGFFPYRAKTRQDLPIVFFVALGRSYHDRRFFPVTFPHLMRQDATLNLILGSLTGSQTTPMNINGHG
jgi:hypothetical protein